MNLSKTPEFWAAFDSIDRALILEFRYLYLRNLRPDYLDSSGPNSMNLNPSLSLETEIVPDLPHDFPKTGIWSASFQGLLWTNWLTAINDNVFRWFVIGAGKDYVPPEYQGNILMAGTACFVLPYIFLASPAGWLADRFSKRNVVVACKIAEIVIMTLAVVALMLAPHANPGEAPSRIGLYLLLFTVLLMGAQSALFAPAKIGNIPELLDEHTISAGNGLFNLATLSAVVIGMVIGGWLADMTGFCGQDNIWLTALVLVGIAVVGTLISLIIRPLPAANVKARFPVTIIGETIRDIIVLVKSGPLFRVALGTIFFFSIAGLAQLNIDAFASDSGAITESQRTPLLVSLVLGLGLGSVLAGFASGGRIELGLVPWGATGMATFCLLLVFAPENFINEYAFNGQKTIACLMLAGIGVCAGFFDVPLASYLQHESPLQTRGAILSANNCLMFSGILIFAVLFSALQAPTFAGSKSNLEQEYQTSKLDVGQQKEIIKWTNEFAAKWQESPENPPDITWFVNRLPQENRVAATTEMLFVEATNLKEQGKQVSIKHYQELFPEQQRQVKSVIRQASGLPLCTSRQIFGLMGLFTIPVAIYAFRRLPLDAVRMVFLLLFKVIYRLRIRGLENIPVKGPAILACNHVSFLDGAIPMTVIPRRMRTIAWAGNFNNWLFKKWADFVGVILMTSGPKSIRKGLAEAAEALKQGQLVAVFPEGGISRTGQVRTFRPGILKIQEKQDQPVPVIPVYIDEVWGSIFSYVGGKVFSRFPNSLRRPLSVHIGQPVDDPMSMFHIRQAVERLGAESVPFGAAKFKSPTMDFVRQCKKRRFSQKIGDSTGQQATGGALLTRTLVLRRLLGKFVLSNDEQTVGVLIPPSFGGVVVNMALGLDRRIAVNLNYSLSEDLINNCLEQAEIKHVLTSRKVMEKFDFKLNAEVYYLEDLQGKVSGMDKAIAALQAFVLPTYFLNRWLGLHRIGPKDLITIVFTSGSTGTPKGVMLSHRNISSNMKAIDQAASFNTSDAMVGILPFFHSFGFTATLWAAMCCNIRGIYHFSPLDPKQVGKLVEKYKGTILVATPTFLRSYMKRCTVEQFESLDMVVAGAERLPPELSDAFEEKFGVRPVEGYGATELSPITAVNIPPSRQYDSYQVECKEGTVGRPLKSIAAKVTDLDTGQELGANEPGMLWITGPNVMQGYLNMPEKTDEVLVDGWYQTGDVVMLDEDGFITITGRMSRFSKIGGEMVPHVKIEELLTKMVDETPNDETDDRPCIAVTAVPHPTKGERLIVLHTAIHKSADELRQGLTAAGLPNLFIPNADSFRQVDELPLLGSGKLDLKGIKQMAVDLFSEKSGNASE